MDATVIDRCASVFDWARFRRTKAAVKLHLLLDHDGLLPRYAVEAVSWLWAATLHGHSLNLLTRFAVYGG